MDCTVSPFGVVEGERVWLYTFVTAGGLEISLTNYGATIVAINYVKGCKHLNLAYGYGNLNPYLISSIHQGGLVGRFANRIEGARFTIDGKTFNLTPNEAGNTLHGGNCGFDRQVWETQHYEILGGVSTISFYLRSASMEEGFPGNLDVWVTYQITDDNQICLNYLAKTDSPTHVNLTTHSYFNLSGFENCVDDMLLQINADGYLPVNESKIPIGEICDVRNTGYDFRKPALIGAKLKLLNGDEFDTCFVLNKPRLNRPSAVLKNPQNGFTLSLYTNQPGMQLYTPTVHPADTQIELPKTGRWAVCLEPQHFPNTPNTPSFPSTLLLPNDEYSHTVIYTFGVES